MGLLVIILLIFTFEKEMKLKDYLKDFRVEKSKRNYWKYIHLLILINLLVTIGSFYFKILMDDIFPNNLNKRLLVISIAMLGLAIIRIITGFFISLLYIYI